MFIRVLIDGLKFYAIIVGWLIFCRILMVIVFRFHDRKTRV